MLFYGDKTITAAYLAEQLYGSFELTEAESTAQITAFEEVQMIFGIYSCCFVLMWMSSVGCSCCSGPPTGTGTPRSLKTSRKVEIYPPSIPKYWFYFGRANDRRLGC